MIVPDAPSPLDLRFRLFGFPVRVAVFFWLIAALFGQGIYAAFGLEYLALWVACFFASILIHELGHAFVFRWFGSNAEIVLYGFGGYARAYPLRKAWQSLLMYSAGPGAGFLLAGIVYVSGQLTQWYQGSLAAALTYSFLLWMNIVWGIFNLLPILPMDGGNILREFLTLLGVRSSQLVALLVSVLLGGTLCLIGFSMMFNVNIPFLSAFLPKNINPFFLTFWMAIMTVMNFQQLKALQQQRSFDRRVTYYADDDDDTPPWRRR